MLDQRKIKFITDQIFNIVNDSNYEIGLYADVYGNEQTQLLINKIVKALDVLLY